MCDGVCDIRRPEEVENLHILVVVADVCSCRCRRKAPRLAVGADVAGEVFYSFCAGIGGQSAVDSGSGDVADGVRIRSG